MIANYTIRDQETFRKYMEAAGSLAPKYNGKVIIYTYDQAGRLSGAAYNGAAIAYTYDAAGNVLNASVSATGVLPDVVFRSLCSYQ